MPGTKLSYTDLAHQVVREASESLPFAEIMHRVNALLPITTKNPKSTIRNAISQSRLIVNTGDGRYGWKYRVINGSGMLEVVDERRVRLNQIAPNVKARFVYEYDFGDSWEHEIVVEKTLPSEKGVPYPHCMDGKRACPPEDAGGVWGYDTFLEAMRDPHHPEHDDMVKWIGGEFDPDAIDLRGVNGALQLFKSYIEREWR